MYMPKGAGAALEPLPLSDLPGCPVDMVRGDSPASSPAAMILTS